MPRRKLAPTERKKPGPKTVRGNLKRCNCSVHKGEYIPLDQFWVFKSGRMKGKPMSRCIDALRRQQGREPGVSGFVPLNRFKFVFRELESRIGRAETCRRAGISINFWYRMDRGITTHARKATIIRLIAVLRECRKIDEVRHRDSINHGAAARGRKEREVKNRRDFNLPTGDDELEARRNYNKRNPEHATKMNKIHYEAKKKKLTSARVKLEVSK